MSTAKKPTRSSTVAKILAESGKTHSKRNAVYCNNYIHAGAALAAFFPDGITLLTPADHERMVIFNLIIVKLTRYAVMWNKGGHKDSIHDTIVYSAILEDIDEHWLALANLNKKKRGE